MQRVAARSAGLRHGWLACGGGSAASSADLVRLVAPRVHSSLPPPQHPTLRAAYSYYNVATTVPLAVMPRPAPRPANPTGVESRVGRCWLHGFVLEAPRSISRPRALRAWGLVCGGRVKVTSTSIPLETSQSEPIMAARP